jgi:hypothetical protein
VAEPTAEKSAVLPSYDEIGQTDNANKYREFFNNANETRHNNRMKWHPVPKDYFSSGVIP